MVNINPLGEELMQDHNRWEPTSIERSVTMQLLERVSRNEQVIENLREDLVRKAAMDRELLNKIDNLTEGLTTAVNDYTLHRTYQKAIKNALYTAIMLIIFFLAFDFKEIGKTIHDFLSSQR